MRRSLVPALLAALTGCGLTSYQKAATQFGGSTSAGVEAARGVVSDAHETCRMRAWFHAVEARFEEPGFARGTDPLARSSGVGAQDGTTLRWGAYCDRIVDYDRAMMGALSALEAYAGALRNAASDDTVALDTDLTAALASDASDLAKALGGSGFAQAKELSGPITALANVALDLVRTQKVKDAVLAGEKPVATILQGIRDYLDASHTQLGDARRLARKLVESADKAIPVRDERSALPRDLPGQALALYEFSRLELARLDAVDARLGATAELVQALEMAHAELVKGARSTVKDAQVRDFVAEKARTIVKQINILRDVGRT